MVRHELWGAQRCNWPRVALRRSSHKRQPQLYGRPRKHRLCGLQLSWERPVLRSSDDRSSDHRPGQVVLVPARRLPDWPGQGFGFPE